MNLIDRLKKYKELNGLTSNEALRDKMCAAGIDVSVVTVSNWMRSQNFPSKMIRTSLENFLHDGGV